MPAWDDLKVGPWHGGAVPPRHDYRKLQRLATAFGPRAARGGRKIITRRFEFNRVLEGRRDHHHPGPDLSKTGGITEIMRIAAIGRRPTSCRSTAHLHGPA